MRHILIILWCSKERNCVTCRFFIILHGSIFFPNQGAFAARAYALRVNELFHCHMPHTPYTFLNRLYRGYLCHLRIRLINTYTTLSDTWRLSVTWQGFYVINVPLVRYVTLSLAVYCRFGSVYPFLLPFLWWIEEIIGKIDACKPLSCRF